MRLIDDRLKYKKTWLCFFWLLIFGVFLTGLMPGNEFPAIPPIPHLDKIAHFMIYLLLAFVLEQLFVAKPKTLFIKAFAIGLIIEVLQTQVPFRSFETADLLANSIGAFAGILLSARVFPDSFLKFDRRLSGLKKS